MATKRLARLMSKCLTRPEVDSVVEQRPPKQDRLNTWLGVKLVSLFCSDEMGIWNSKVLLGRSELVEPETYVKTLVTVRTTAVESQATTVRHHQIFRHWGNTQCSVDAPFPSSK